MTEVLGIDHVYFSVRDLEASRRFYDAVLGVLGFRRGSFRIGDDEHASYISRHFGIVLRPARSNTVHDPYAAGLHHFCLRVDTAGDVDAAAADLAAAGVTTTAPRLYPEYAPDYYAIFLEDPDGLRLEVTNYRQERRDRHDHWESVLS